jgi:hypothetical protein
VDNNLVNSHKELRPGNMFVKRARFDIEFGFPMSPTWPPSCIAEQEEIVNSVFQLATLH